jgi:hypothetical protein
MDGKPIFLKIKGFRVIFYYFEQLNGKEEEA